MEMCLNCRFHRLDADDLLLCKRYPKKVYKNRDDWCGEYAAQQSVQPTGGTVAPANIEQRPEVDSAGEDNQRPATSR